MNNRGSEHVSLHGKNDNESAYERHHHNYPRGHHLVNTDDDNGDVELVEPPREKEDEFQDEPIDLDDDDDKQTPSTAIGSARTPWYGTAVILLSEVMGTGILSLPHAAKVLGWASAIVAVPLFAGFASYSGWLLSCVYNDGGIKAHSFAEASTQLLGPTMGQFTKVAMLVNWGATAIYYLIATADGIGDILGTDTALNCSYKRSLISALLLVLPCQCRDFYSISKYLSLPSTCAIILMVFVIIGNLISTSTTTTTIDREDYNGTMTNATTSSFGETTTIGPEEGTTPLDYLEALSAFVFAYQGHAIFLELMSEMKDSHQFPKACGMAYGLMCVMYAMTVVVAYGLRGEETEEFLPDILAAGPARKVVGLLVCLHITVSYVIACQPLHVWLHATIFPQTLGDESKLGSIHWFLLTTGFLAFGFVVGNLIPFFADVQALIGSLFGAPTIFAWPVGFYVVVQRRRVESWRSTLQLMGCGQVAVCAFFLLICTPVFVLLGTGAAITSIVEDAEHAAKPFECD